MNPVSPLQRRVLREIVGVLEARGIAYQATGGLAGNVHGSRWPLHDLDFDVANDDLPRVEALFADFVTRPTGRYVDDEFDLRLLRLNVRGVEVDVSGASGGLARGRPIVADLARAETRDFLGLRLRVQPLADLVAYKTLLGREADLADLRSLRPSPNA